MSCTSCLNCIPPIVIILLVCYTYYAYVVEYCFLFLNNLVKKTAYLIIYHFLLLMFLWCFLKTVCEPHDSVPHEYKLTQAEHNKLISFTDEQIDLILRKLIDLRKLEIYTCSDNGRIRYCRNCLLVKPDRTHHCSTCNKCILKMDHHCPWVYNCVGFCNYKQFLLMLMYAMLLCLFCTGSLAEYILEFWRDFQSNWNKLHPGVAFLIGALMCVLVLTLFFYHCGLLSRNETTLEALRDVAFINENLTFDLGNWKNFLEVFGHNACFWLIPVRSSEGNGYEFSVKQVV